jgi:hypothetical protein
VLLNCTSRFFAWTYSVFSHQFLLPEPLMPLDAKSQIFPKAARGASNDWARFSGKFGYFPYDCWG